MDGMDRMDEGWGLGTAGFASALAVIADVKLGGATPATAGAAVGFAIAVAIVIAARQKAGGRVARCIGSLAALLATAASVALAVVHLGGFGASFLLQLALGVGVLGVTSVGEALLPGPPRRFREVVASLCFFATLVAVLGAFLASLLFRWVLQARPEARPFTFWSLSLALGVGFFVCAIVAAIRRSLRRHALSAQRPRD
jgi:hypothetical protein